MGLRFPHDQDLQPPQGLQREVKLMLFSIIDLDLEVNKTYEFKFKHGSQYLID